MRLLGPSFRNKRDLEERLNAKILIRNDQITLSTTSAARMKRAEQLFSEYLRGRGSPASGAREPSLPAEGAAAVRGGGRHTVVTEGRRSNVVLKSRGQERFHKAVMEHDLTFVIGPAGTGKTYLAVAMAVEALKVKSAERIVLARPAVEAGESLGFLPGNLREKVEPYLAPLYDALFDILPGEAIRGYFEDKAIEVSPLAYMRGRTLNNAFIILDEAQNATLSQMKMFLTRLGNGSRAIVAGDVTQIDLPVKHSGLLRIREVLKGVPGVAFVHLDGTDVVRHPLVRRIIGAYEAFERRRGRAA